MATTDKSPGEESLARLPRDAVGTVQSEFAGEIVLPSNGAYDEARRIWNGMIDRYPAIIAQCAGVADVVAAVDFAREHELPVAVRGGGHNVAGTAVTDGGLVIDLSNMRSVRVDRETETVRVEGGATLGDVDRETQLFGLATALGAVSETGVAGLTLNGGYGHLSRQYGLAADNLVSVDVVTADGEVRTASADRNADLFWALRGGGGAFGVVTSFEFALHEVGPDVETLFSWYTGDDAATAVDRYREWVETAPRDAGVLMFAAHVPELEEFPESVWGDPAVAFLGSSRGDRADVDHVFESLRAGLTPVADFSRPMAFTDLQSMLDEDYPDGLRYYWKSIYVTAITDDLVDVVLQCNESAPSALSTVDIWHLDGAVAEVPQDETAFWHRDKPYMVTFEANWEDPANDDVNVTWAREGIADVQALPVASGRYGNFPGLNEDPGKMLYGENYDRLVDVKSTYDPSNLFRGNGAIVPNAAD
ncbi:FAD linked oxidase [Natrialba hulunbeirensis JCM 10989]|uniref:FAD linked oxidase n=1 Tax=Natrialba hulunbeirensis JCM 10989 TaxID=1227493 RepID=M0A2B7_9EURY|nr:FAD-binding oxidoreductase [Natrialba hulunbeirensis]ELY92764.1 FAD linked oxidase [Natrialba hulunbeirensis JCM 10989]